MDKTPSTSTSTSTETATKAEIEFAVPLKVYAVVNSSGQLLRRIGYGGSGGAWTDDVKDARLWFRISAARAQVTWWAKNYPEYPLPNILEFSLHRGVLINEQERVQKSIQKAKERIETRELRDLQSEQKRLERSIAESKAKLEKIRNKGKATGNGEVSGLAEYREQW